ncbi:MAG TPA: molybdate ABC transporter substrate-binding protein [Phenylobacterium sp.]|nr:molybdate ABC transporter substrate-binding protein [Phenylobacterium sp.]
MLRRIFFLVSALAVFAAGPAAAAEVRVATAANFTEPAREIARLFEDRTGHKVVLSFGSSGQFYAQIRQGAPFDVFLSADVERARQAEASGLTAPGRRFTYATGRLALYRRSGGPIVDGAAVLRAGAFDKLAIADPATAPYGQAAVQTLRRLGLHETLAPKLVQGGSITQAYQFAATGAAELGLVALSQVIGGRGDYWIVPERLHDPIDQQAVLLRRGAANPAAVGFVDFLQGPQAKAVIRRYRYQTP